MGATRVVDQDVDGVVILPSMSSRASRSSRSDTSAWCPSPSRWSRECSVLAMLVTVAPQDVGVVAIAAPVPAEPPQTSA